MITKTQKIIKIKEQETMKIVLIATVIRMTSTTTNQTPQESERKRNY